jgi:hypothetical protein
LHMTGVGLNGKGYQWCRPIVNSSKLHTTVHIVKKNPK